MLIIFIHVLRNYSESRILKTGWMIAFTLLVLQVITGMLSVFTQVNIFIALMHALFITLLFGVLCCYNTSIKKQVKLKLGNLNLDFQAFI